MKSKLSLTLLLLSLNLPAQAQITSQSQCLPSPDLTRLYASKAGACIQWVCLPSGQWNTYCGVPTELSKVGSRVQTILKSSNPLLSWQQSETRFSVAPLTDPQFSEVVKLLPGGF